jgi:capsular polysaccharide biosynthesis protein
MDLLEIDYRRYAARLARRWRLITLVVAACTGLGVVASLYWATTAPVYEARALVLVSKPRYQLELEPKLKTNTEAFAATALSTRLPSLALIARSTEVEAAVQQRLAATLPAEQQPHTLANAVTIRARPTTEFLEVVAQAREPQLAIKLANTWAEEVANRIDQVYGPEAGTEAIEQQQAKARSAYEAADRELQQLSLGQPIDDLRRRIGAKEDQIRVLQEQRTDYLRVRTASLYSSLNELDQLIRDAATLETQLRQPVHSQASASGDALALLLLRSRSYLPHNGASSAIRGAPSTTGAGAQPGTETRMGVTVIAGASQPIGLQVSPERLVVPGERVEDRLGDLNVMIQALRERRAELQTELEGLAGDLQGGSESASEPSSDPMELALSQAQSEVVKLRAELAALSLRQDELSRNRDLLKTTYDTLRTKSEELRVARTTIGPQASVAEQASAASSLAQPRVLRTVAVAAVVGVLLGALLALVLDHLAQRRSPRPLHLEGTSGAPGDSPPAPAVALRQR